MKKWMIALIAVLVVAGVGAGGYFLGMRAGEQKVVNNPSLVFQRMGGQGGQIRIDGQFPGQDGAPTGDRGGMQFQGGGLAGTIESVSGSTVVIKTDQGSIAVKTTDSTLIEKNVSVGVGELAVGESVMVSGSKNDDGSYTARSIQSMRQRALTQPGQ
ncbi:MAG: hypothetical protein BWY10_00609 [Chloroflexi bacterium ADurb.Bin180]|nr:MAG: hypothetical protein BWY10_00609 [Chloroflexi bacterium ADurb.Bin180]HOU23766.1 DUF5666 domain-containing protein [Anaerolineae bacterium]